MRVLQVEKQSCPSRNDNKHNCEMITMPPPARCLFYSPSFPEFLLIKNECLAGPESFNFHAFLK